MEEDTENYEEARRNYLHTRFPPLISVSEIRRGNIPNPFPRNNLFDYYSEDSDRQEEHILEDEQKQELNLQQEDNEEQNNQIGQEQDEVRQEQELNLEEEDNEEQVNPAEEEEAEVQQHQRRSTGFGQLFDPTEVLDNQVQQYIPAHFFDEEMALTQAAVNAWRTAVERQAQILENGLGVINAQTAKKEIPFFTREIEGKLAIEEWFKIAERIATNAGWTNEQRLRFFSRKVY